jgi:hypothetical protein
MPENVTVIDRDLFNRFFKDLEQQGLMLASSVTYLKSEH